MNKSDLRLPVIRSKPMPKKWLSMDEYEQFNREDLENAFDGEAYLREKRLREVNVAFKLVE